MTGTQPRKVLLFAGDAQVGNWLSWYSLSWAGEGEHSIPNAELVAIEGDGHATILETPDKVWEAIEEFIAS